MQRNKRLIYVTGRLENLLNVQAAIAAMLSAGDTEVIYDWTDKPETSKANFAALQRACYARLSYLPQADIVLALLPGGRGTHADLALCMGAQASHDHPDYMSPGFGMPLFLLHSETPEKEFGLAEEASYLYHHPLSVRIGGSMQALLSFLGQPKLYDRVQEESARIGSGAWITLKEPVNINLEVYKPSEMRMPAPAAMPSISPLYELPKQPEKLSESEIKQPEIPPQIPIAVVTPEDILKPGDRLPLSNTAIVVPEPLPDSVPKEPVNAAPIEAAKEKENTDPVSAPAQPENK